MQIQNEDGSIENTGQKTIDENIVDIHTHPIDNGPIDEQEEPVQQEEEVIEEAPVVEQIP